MILTAGAAELLEHLLTHGADLAVHQCLRHFLAGVTVR